MTFESVDYVQPFCDLRFEIKYFWLFGTLVYISVATSSKYTVFCIVGKNSSTNLYSNLLYYVYAKASCALSWQVIKRINTNDRIINLKSLSL